MIILNWFISNVPTTVFVFGASSTKPQAYLKPYAIWERLQLSLYFIQEMVISFLYVYEILRMLKPKVFQSHKRSESEGNILAPVETSRKWRSETSRLVLKHLVYINVLIVMLDISLLVTEYIGHYEVQVIYKVSTILFCSYSLWAH
jgi:hypothetical protein